MIHKHSSNLSYLLPFASAAFGAFCGAVGAFRLGRVKQKRDELDRRHSVLLAAQYALFNQWNTLESIRRDTLEPQRQDQSRHINLPLSLHAMAHLSVPFNELTFIVDSDEPNLLQQIHLAEQGYLSAKNILERYNELRKEFDDKYPPNDIGKVTAPAHENLLLKTVADALYEQFDIALPKFDEQIKKICKFIGRNFKDKKALSGITPNKTVPP
jgi:hypothetical protein